MVDGGLSQQRIQEEIYEIHQKRKYSAFECEIDFNGEKISTVLYGNDLGGKIIGTRHGHRVEVGEKADLGEMSLEETFEHRKKYELAVYFEPDNLNKITESVEKGVLVVRVPKADRDLFRSQIFDYIRNAQTILNNNSYE